jgi:hypothetical protein
MTHRPIVALSAALLVVGATAGSSALQFPPPGPGGGWPGGQADRPVVKEFDNDGNGWLDAEERRAARESLGTVPGGRGGFGGGFGRGFGGRGRGGRGGMAPGTPGPRVDITSVAPVPASVPFYAPDTIRTLFFQFENDDWEQELEVFRNTDVEVPATLVVDGQRYENVGMRFRGNSSYMMVPTGLKRSFNVTVDLAVEGQSVYGFRTLNLLNGANDPTMMRGVLFQHIAGHYVPAARANFVHVVINGESWGIYSNLEQLNRDFVADRFNGENGVRWKVPGSPRTRAGLEYQGDDPAPYKQWFEIKNKDNRRSWDALINLTKVLNTTPTDRLEEALAAVLDIDGALKFLALDNVLVNTDGYWTRASDYYLYLDESGRFHVIPGDTNETFGSSGGPGPGGRGGFGMGSEGGPQLDLLIGLDDPTKPLRSKLLAVPSLREKYLEYCRDIATTWLDWQKLGPIAQQHHERIAKYVEADTRKLVSTEQFMTSLEQLRSFVEARRAYVLSYRQR